MAEQLDRGRVVTLERDPERAAQARAYLERGGVADRVEIVEPLYPFGRAMIRLMRILLIVFAIGQLALGVALWLAPGFFHDEIGPYGARNDHYMADLATFYLALGAVTLVAVQRASWRVPVLAFALIQYGLHSLNHLIDIGESDPSWLGPANFVSLLLTTLLLGWMLRRESEVIR